MHNNGKIDVSFQENVWRCLLLPRMCPEHFLGLTPRAKLSHKSRKNTKPSRRQVDKKVVTIFLAEKIPFFGKEDLFLLFCTLLLVGDLTWDFQVKEIAEYRLSFTS